ncbi:hypothetical protein [Clostridium sp.]|uniref:hypothetical protein n=1 Tax=Clostridium sp. TaxID=1506 RepID=UPI0028429269|nr:hypothetical protein [Clostridium sp.]MDR3594613.1 hypothetical protein [Clostridium sp.]
MSDIDYIKNVQVIGNLAVGASQFKFTATNLPITNPPDVCIIKQISYLSNFTVSSTFSLWTDLTSSNVSSFSVYTGDYTVGPLGITTTPDIMIKLAGPIAGDVMFRLLEINAGGNFGEITSDGHITIQLEFVRYKRNA